jgi:hypothetical protein
MFLFFNMLFLRQFVHELCSQEGIILGKLIIEKSQEHKQHFDSLIDQLYNLRFK